MRSSHALQAHVMFRKLFLHELTEEKLDQLNLSKAIIVSNVRAANKTPCFSYITSIEWVQFFSSVHRQVVLVINYCICCFNMMIPS